MNEVSKIQLNKDAESLLSHIFYDRIIQIGSKNNDNTSVPISKQMQLKNLKDEILTFVERNPDSEFDIRILHKDTEDNENFKISLIFRNFKEVSESRMNKFVIILSHNLSSVTYYQWSLNHILILIK